MKKATCIYLCALMLLAVSWQAPVADAPAKPDDKKAAEPAKDKDTEKPSKPEEVRVETNHVVTINGQSIKYTVVTGTILLRDIEEKPTASIFYIAYTKDGVSDKSKRPVTFSFNGGPGSSSVWLHLGLLGPRRVLLKEDGDTLPPPYKLVDNEYSLLDETDLVFIDPVSTGFSRAVKPEDAKKFHGVEGDISRSPISFASTRRGTIAGNRRKFIIGESYGTTRAAGLSGELREHQHA